MNTQKKPFDLLVNRHLDVPTPHPEFALLSPDGNTLLITIQKNASSFVWKWALENNWSSRKTESTNPKYLAVILREPIGRWKSAIVQFLYQLLVRQQGYTDEKLEQEWSGIVTSLIKSGPAFFDIHTWPQHYWRTTFLPTTPRMYFKFEDHLNFTLARTFDWNTPSNEINVVGPGFGNVGKTNLEKIKLTNLVEDMLEKDPGFMLKLQEVFKEDIEIYNSVDFTTKILTRQDLREGVSYDDYK